MLLFRKGIDIFSKSGTLLTSPSADVCKEVFCLENGFFWYVYFLLMIVSFDTIKCGKKIYFFQQETVVVVEICETQLSIFLKRSWYC